MFLFLLLAGVVSCFCCCGLNNVQRLRETNQDDEENHPVHDSSQPENPPPPEKLSDQAPHNGSHVRPGRQDHREQAHGPPTLVLGKQVHHAQGAQRHGRGEEPVDDPRAQQLSVRPRGGVRRAQGAREAEERAREVDRAPAVDVGQGDPQKGSHAVERDDDGRLVRGLDEGDTELGGELGVGWVDDGRVEGAQGGEEGDLDEDEDLWVWLLLT